MGGTRWFYARCLANSAVYDMIPAQARCWDLSCSEQLTGRFCEAGARDIEHLR